MVNMLADKSSDSERDAAARCSRGWPGKSSTHVERLRRRYRTLGRRGKLPAPETPATRFQVKVDQLRSRYELDEARTEAAKPELAREEEKAKALGLDIEGSKLGPLLMGLDQAINRLESVVIYSTDVAYAHYKEQRLTADEAIAKFKAAEETLRSLVEKVKLLRNIRDLRVRAGVHY